MTDQALLDRVTINSKIMSGKPVIRGTCLTVESILNLLAHGTTAAKIDDFNREIELTRQSRALMKLLETRSKPKKRIPLAEARMQLGLNKPAAT